MILAQATTHFTYELEELFDKYHSKLKYIPKGCTSYNQPLDKAINKPLKDNLCIFIDNYNQKHTYEHLIVSINDIWYNDFVRKDTIINSFLVTGIINDFDGSEDNKFIFATHISEYIEDYMEDKFLNQ